MKLNEMKPNEGAVRDRIRVGRGIGSGKGKTSGKGHKGQKARSGVAIKGFEGGQMPLHRRLPKIGFRNTAFAFKFSEVSLGKIQTAIDEGKLDSKKPVDEDSLIAAGVVRRKRDGIKLLATGTLKAKLTLKLSKASKTAIASVEKAGGSVELIEISVPKEKIVREKSSKAKVSAEKN